MKRSILISTCILLSIITSVAQVSPVQMGRASNAFTVLRPEQNQVFADNSSNTVSFIHRQDVTVWGGGTAENGRLRYDISIDGGSTFSNDIGLLNNLYSQVSRYPQITGIGNSANPFSNNFVWAAPTLAPSGGWDGMATGVSAVQTTNPLPFTSENYQYIGDSTYLQGGLCQGLTNELWMSEVFFPNGQLGDSLRIYKGTYNTITGAVIWTRHTSLYLDHYLGYSGAPTVIGPNMAFSPSGADGWAAYLGDLNGGSDTTVNPIFVHSSNGGSTWGAPMEVDLRTVQFMGSSNTLMEELQALWVDTAGNPMGSGRPTCAFDYDMTVDANGNPHLFTVIANASANGGTLGYSLQPGFAKLAVDIYSEDGGQTWKAVKVAPIYAFRANHGTGDGGNGVLMDNYPQISRTQNGSHIFYSWADSDTTDIGFGVSDNTSPNLRIASQRISDGFMTCPKWITKGDVIWDGRALFPTMAPEVLTDSLGSTYMLPIVITDMIVNDHEQPCNFYYFGNDATIDDSEYIAPALYLSSDNCQISGVERKPVLEVGTGTWGGFGPDGSVVADDVATIHPSITSVFLHNSDSLANTVSTDITNVMTNGYPSGFIDRLDYDTSLVEIMYSRSLWAVSALERFLTAAPVTVGLDSISFNSSTNELSVRVNADFHRSVSGDLRFNVMVMEDNVTGYPQQNFYDTTPGHPFFGAGNPIVNYAHPNVLRTCLGGAWGTSGIIPASVSHGDSYSTTYTYTIPAGYDLTEIKLLGVVQRFDADLAEREILNSSGSVPLIDFCTPEAAFSSSVSDLAVTFTDESAGGPTSYLWDFGDGNLSVLQNPVHTYTSAGSYTVCLTTTNGCGSDSTCSTVNVYPCDNPSSHWVTDIQSDEVRIVWNTETSAIKYKLKVRAVGTNTWTNHTIFAPDTFKVKGNLNPGTDYEYKVQTVCNINSPAGYGPFQYFTTASACSNPSTVTMVGINQTQTNAYWTSVPEAVSYKLKYRPVGTSIWKYKTVYAPDTSRNLYNLIPDTEYEYKIRTECNNGNVPYGPFAYFNTLNCGIGGNRTEVAITPNSAILLWDPVPGAVSYKVKYRINNTSTWSYKNVTAPTSSTQVNFLQAGTTYQWKVKTFCAPTSNYSSYSGNNLFSTPGTAQEQELSRLANGSDADDTWINIYPNPSSGRVTIDMYGFDDQQTVRIMDMAGKVVFVDAFEVSGSSLSRTINLDVAGGTYFVHFTGVNGTTKRKLIVQ